MANLAEDLVARTGATLVSWRHDSIFTIARHLGEVTPAPPRDWPGDRYDVVWTFTREGNVWHFGQVPRMLMPGDLPYPISYWPPTADPN